MVNFQFFPFHLLSISYCDKDYQNYDLQYLEIIVFSGGSFRSEILTILTQIAIAAITSSGFEHFINGCGTVDGVPDSSLCSRQASSNRLSLWLNHCFGKILQKPGSSTLVPLLKMPQHACNMLLWVFYSAMVPWAFASVQKFSFWTNDPSSAMEFSLGSATISFDVTHKVTAVEQRKRSNVKHRVITPGSQIIKLFNISLVTSGLGPMTCITKTVTEMDRK